MFDEAGFPGDPSSPHFYVGRGGRVLPTGESNVPVEGLWVDSSDGRADCDPTRDGEGCVFRPFSAGNEGVNCSLGFMHFLPNVRGFCPRALRNRVRNCIFL